MTTGSLTLFERKCYSLSGCVKERWLAEEEKGSVGVIYRHENGDLRRLNAFRVEICCMGMGYRL